MTYYLALDEKLPRRTARIQTLRNYIRKYPRGWKKHLELAHLLFATGEWEEAIREYRLALSKATQATSRMAALRRYAALDDRLPYLIEVKAQCDNLVRADFAILQLLIKACSLSGSKVVLHPN